MLGALTSWLVLLPLAAGHAASAPVVAEGEARAVVVTADSPSPATAYAAEELDVVDLDAGR